MPFLAAKPLGLEVVPLDGLLIRGNLAVQRVLVVDGLEVYGPLDLLLPVPVLEGNALDPSGHGLLLDRLAETRVDLPVRSPAEHRLDGLPKEREVRVGGRFRASHLS